MSTEAAATPNESDATATVAKPGRLYYGWIMLAVVMAGLIATSPGQTFGVSIFNEPMRLALGLSHGELAAAYMLGTLLASLPITYIGSLMDRHGLRRMMVIAVLLFGLACLVASQAAGWASLFLAFFLLRLLGPGALAFLSGNTLAFWFHRRLGMVEGIRHVGMAVAMAVIPSLNLWLLDQFGWRGSYALLGVAVWAVMLPLVLLLFRNSPADVGQALDGADDRTEGAIQNLSASTVPPSDFTAGEALRTRSFWIVSGGAALYGLIHTAVFFSIVPILLDRGLNEGDAAGMLTVFAISLAAMQLIGGTLSDRVPARLLLPVSLCGLAASIKLLDSASTAGQAAVAGVLMGLSQGLYFGTSNPLWARYFGRLHLGKIRGMLMTLQVGASSAGPLMFGVARDVFGSYDLVLMAFAVLPLPLALAAFLATPPLRSGQPEVCRSVSDDC